MPKRMFLLITTIIDAQDKTRARQFLTPANVNWTHFGKLYSASVDGWMFAQPLIVRNVSIPYKGTHNVAYVVTENDSLYAIDADNGSVLWKMSFINQSAGITTVSASDIPCTQFSPNVGITSTPVIDPGTGTIYLVAVTKENGSYVQRLHAIDIAAHVEKFGGPKIIEASVSGTGTASENGRVSLYGTGQ
jgi:PQQ enzyme repeat